MTQTLFGFRTGEASRDPKPNQVQCRSGDPVGTGPAGPRPVEEFGAPARFSLCTHQGPLCYGPSWGECSQQAQQMGAETLEGAD